jgi:hypothetical protein
MGQIALMWAENIYSRPRHKDIPLFLKELRQLPGKTAKSHPGSLSGGQQDAVDDDVIVR